MTITKVDLICERCSKKFQRRKTEHERNMKNGIKHVYCSISCGTIINNKTRDRSNYKSNHIALYAHNRLDEYSPFKTYFKTIKQRKKKIIDITIDDLKNQWEKQNGICPLTGWEMILPKTTDWMNAQVKQPGRNPRQASLDRIDNSLGYVPGNIRWVCQIVNLAKNSYTDDALIEFCKAVVKYHK